MSHINEAMPEPDAVDLPPQEEESIENKDSLSEFLTEYTEEGADKALTMAFQYGGYDGGHHKMWVIDQMVRALTGEKYEEFVKHAMQGEDGPETYSWDTGIAP